MGESGVTPVMEVNPEENPTGQASGSPYSAKKGGRTKLEAYGLEMVEKEVRSSGTCGRVYLPGDWVGCRVKIIRLD
jgi:putative transposon-encoded protein